MSVNNHVAKTGTFCQLMSATAAECLCHTDLDYLIVDAEHTPISDESVLSIVHATSRWPEKLYIRTKDAARSSLLRMLDLGPAGIIIPDVHSAEQVADIVRYSKYYPTGNRGVAFGRGAEYGMHQSLSGGITRYFSAINQRSKVIPQCETAGALNEIEKICSMPGVDGIFIGPYDLSVSLGIPGQLQNAIMLDAMQRILSACKENNKISMIYANDKQAAASFVSQGFDYVTLGTDIQFLLKGMKSALPLA